MCEVSKFSGGSCPGQGCEPISSLHHHLLPLARSLARLSTLASCLDPLATFSTTTMSQTRALTRSTTGPIAPNYGPIPTDSAEQIWHPQNAHTSDASVGASVGKTLGQGVCELQSKHQHQHQRPAPRQATHPRPAQHPASSFQP